MDEGEETKKDCFFRKKKICLFLQVRKELEACGIELYPQKEFDEDMEDKSDNDKIRVSKDSIAPDSQLDIHTQ